MRNLKNNSYKTFTVTLLVTLLITLSSFANAQMTNIRVIHLSPDAPAVDVLVNESLRAVTDLEFPDSTGYLTIDPGTYTFDVVPAGAGIEDSVMTIPDIFLNVNNYYTAVAYNELSMISPLALVDDYSSLPHGTNRLRAIHTAVGVGEVDIWLIPEMGSPVPLWENVGFGVAGNYLEVPAEALTIGFDVDDDASPDVVFDVPALASGTSANVFAATDSTGALFLNAQFMDGTTVRIDPTPPPAPTTNIRVIHLSPDAPAVDVLVNESLRAVTDLEFPDSTGYLTIDAGTYTFDVVPAGGDIGSSVMTIADLPLDADTYYTAVAYNELSMISPLALVDDYSSLPHGTNRLRAIHTAVGVGEVDIWLIPEMGSPVPLWENVGFGVAGNYLEVPSEALTIGFDVDDDASPDVVFDVPALASGTSANVFAATDSTGALFLNAQFMDGTTVRIDPRVCPLFGVDLFVPEGTVMPGDTFYVTATTCNPGEPETLPFFGILDVGTGEYWFFPSWVSSNEGIDYLDFYVDSGVIAFAMIPEMVWPDIGGITLEAHFYGALLNPEMNSIMGISDVETVKFGM